MEADTWNKSSLSTDISSCVEVQWHKSSLSGHTQCVEVGVAKKSSLSGPHDDACVEVEGAADGDVLVRDTKDHGQGPVLRYSKAEWSAFIGGVKLGEFDID